MYHIYQEQFHDSKYIRIYFDIINNPSQSKDTYTERHHILPISLFPDFIKDKNNLVTLSAKEHYIVHLLLYKHFKHLNNKRKTFQMYKAWHMMAFCCNANHKRVTERKFTTLRKITSTLNKTFRHSEESKQKISEAMKGSGNPMFGYQWTKEQMDLKVAKYIGRKHSKETREKMGKVQRLYISNLKKEGKDHFNKGKKVSYEIREKMRKSAINRKNKHKKHERVVCPYCKVVGGKSIMTRWHGKNCKNYRRD